MKQVKQQADLFKLADAFFKNLIFDSGSEFGYVGLDTKRPFGNSYVEGDILKIIGAPKSEDGYTDEQEEYVRCLYCNNLIPYLRKVWKEYKDMHTTGSTYLRTVRRIDR
jgi:hypothetical protein